MKKKTGMTPTTKKATAKGQTKLPQDRGLFEAKRDGSFRSVEAGEQLTKGIFVVNMDDRLDGTNTDEGLVAFLERLWSEHVPQ